MTTSAHHDEAMLAYLATDTDVLAAAARIWDTSGNVCAAQRELEVATDAYSRAITDSGIPAADVGRLGAALILRLHRAAMMAELGRAAGLDEAFGP